MLMILFFAFSPMLPRCRHYADAHSFLADLPLR